MSMRQKDREEFISIMSAEGVPLAVSRQLLRAGATLHRLAELECSSEAADRDQVPCPGGADSCLCRDYGSYTPPSVVSYAPGRYGHGTVPRITVQADRRRRRVEGLCRAQGLAPIFGGDPRGAVLIIKVPSGRTNDWGQRGVVAG
jgi:hypothetical protein